ncbi:unnamed protein product [Ceratitis capitata]|uniref:(Mediterranean fruit fly) hypothetical protein n=1 Tax=Ceratitis capitata TaxID=7213 RepID=A0A811UPR9_CERCA|nr:unnamed protein product [Ceratitis capitata]
MILISKLNKVLSEELVDNKELLSEFDNEDQEVVQEELKDKINTIIKLELESRIEELAHDKTNDYNGLQDEIGHSIVDTTNK